MATHPTKSGAPTADDWAAMHKKAFHDQAFRKLFESDPTAAVAQYAAEHNKSFSQIVNTDHWVDTSKPYSPKHHPPGGDASGCSACC